MHSGRASTGDGPSRVRPRLRLDIPTRSPVLGSLDSLRSQISSMFSGRSTIDRRPSARDQASPKSPAPRLGLSAFTNHSRIQLPYMSTDVASGRRSPSSTHSIIDPSSSPSSAIQPMPAAALQRHDSASNPALSRQVASIRTLSSRSTPVRGADREEDSLLHLMGHEHRRRRRRKQKQRPRDTSQSLVARAMKKKGVRHRAFTCLLLGIILAVVLSICRFELFVRDQTLLTLVQTLLYLLRTLLMVKNSTSYSS